MLDDLLALRTGDQVPADGRVQRSDGLEIDESLLTGESDSVAKSAGDEVLSGQHRRRRIRDGSRPTRVGADSYARRLAHEARRFTLVRSELMDGINLILRYVTWAIVPTAVLLAFSQFRAHEGWREAMAGVVAGVVAMVPEGLVLLTSLSFAIAAVTLARRQVLVQEIPAVEVLARVDVVCLDKTGTLTEGTIVFDEIETLGRQCPGRGRARCARGRRERATRPPPRLAEAFPAPDGWSRTGYGPVLVGTQVERRRVRRARLVGTRRTRDGLGRQAGRRSRAPPGRRARGRGAAGAAARAQRRSRFGGEALPGGLEAVGARDVRGEDPARRGRHAARTSPSRASRCKVISGDNPRTVGAVARSVGLTDAGDAGRRA